MPEVQGQASAATHRAMRARSASSPRLVDSAPLDAFVARYRRSTLAEREPPDVVAER